MKPAPPVISTDPKGPPSVVSIGSRGAGAPRLGGGGGADEPRPAGDQYRPQGSPFRRFDRLAGAGLAEVLLVSYPVAAGANVACAASMSMTMTTGFCAWNGGWRPPA